MKERESDNVVWERGNGRKGEKTKDLLMQLRSRERERVIVCV